MFTTREDFQQEYVRHHKRLLECRWRRDSSPFGSCHLLNDSLGWQAQLATPDCDKCWALNPDSEKATQYRTDLKDQIVNDLVSKPPAQLPARVALTIGRKHIPDKDVVKFLKGVVTKNPEEFISIAAERGCEQEVRSHYNLLTEEEKANGLDKNLAWDTVQPDWDIPLEEWSLLEKGVYAAEALTSGWLTDSPEDKATYAARMESCFGTDEQPMCPSLRRRKDGKPYCGHCGCGEKDIAILIDGPKEKLRRRKLRCPRRRPGFTNAILTVSATPKVDRVVLINLKRRPDRLKAALEQINGPHWPKWLPPVEIFEAVDGDIMPPALGWESGKGAWGCMQSHRKVLEQALADKINIIMVLEDDFLIKENFAADLEAFFKAVPHDWDQLMIGGQHINFTETPPTTEREGVVKCVNCQRTHAYIVRGNFLKELYQTWMAGTRHCDHIMGPMQATRKVYAPHPFLVAQREGKSDINGRVNPLNFWTPPSRLGPVLVVTGNLLPMQIQALHGKAHNFGYDRAPHTQIDRVLVEAFTETNRKIFERKIRKWVSSVDWECAQSDWRMTPTMYHPDTSKNLKDLAKILKDRMRVVPATELTNAGQ